MPNQRSSGQKKADQAAVAALARSFSLHSSRKTFISPLTLTIRDATPLYFLMAPVTVRVTAPWLTRLCNFSYVRKRSISSPPLAEFRSRRLRKITSNRPLNSKEALEESTATSSSVMLSGARREKVGLDIIYYSRNPRNSQPRSGQPPTSRSRGTTACQGEQRSGRGFQNPDDFGDCLGSKFCAVICRHDRFRFCAIQVRAPVGHYAIAALRRIAFPSIADDGVIRYAVSNREFIYFHDEAIIRRQRIDAVRNSV